MTFVIPNQESKTHLQNNINDLEGTIFKSRNIDLDEKGYIKLASPTVAVMTTDDDADLDTVDAMYPSDSQIYMNSDEMFVGDMTMDTLTNRNGDTNRVTPSVEEDVIFFNDTEVVSDGSVVKYQSSINTWTTISPSLGTTTPTAMASWETEGVLAVGNDNIVKFIDTTWAVHATTLTLPPDFQVSSLAVQGSQLFIGTRSKSGGEAMMFVVSTIQVGIDLAYGVGTFEISSLKPFKSSLALIVSNGSLLRFNGGGFDVLAVLPVNKKDIEWASANNDYTTTGNRAMTVDGDLIYINLSADTQNGVFRTLPYFPAGVWCYDDTTGSLYHRYSPTYSRVLELFGSSVAVDTANDDFTLTSGNLDRVITGMPVMYNEGGSPKIPDLNESIVYYMIKNSSTEFQLATSYTNAIASVPMDITGSGNISQKWWVQITSDYGFTQFDNRMAMAVLNSKLFDDTVMGRICLSGEIFSKQDATTMTAVCGTSPFLPNRGYFVTPRLNSPNLEDEYTNVHIKYAPLDVDDIILIKYKDVEKLNYPFDSTKFSLSGGASLGTWTDDDTFTTTFDMSAVVEGEEVELIAGVGSGHISKIESITESAGTYTVNLSEAFPFAVANDICKFSIDNWKEAGRIDFDTQKKGGGFALPVGKKSKFVQVKVELRGVKVKIEELIINNKVHKPVV